LLLLPCTEVELRNKVPKIREKEKEKLKDSELQILSTCIFKVVEAELAFHKEIEGFKGFLSSMQDFNLEIMFNAVAMFGSQPAIGVEALSKFLRQMGHPPLKEETQAIVRRIDLDCDNQIGP